MQRSSGTPHFIQVSTDFFGPIKGTGISFPTWLVEDIENETVAPGNVAMWWLGCTGVWFKTPKNTNITIDLWCGNGKRTHGDNKMKPGHQMVNLFTFLCKFNKTFYFYELFELLYVSFFQYKTKISYTPKQIFPQKRAR